MITVGHGDAQKAGGPAETDAHAVRRRHRPSPRKADRGCYQAAAPAARGGSEIAVARDAARDGALGRLLWRPGAGSGPLGGCWKGGGDFLPPRVWDGGGPLSS